MGFIQTVSIVVIIVSINLIFVSTVPSTQSTGGKKYFSCIEKKCLEDKILKNHIISLSGRCCK